MPRENRLEEIRRFAAEFIAATHLEVAPAVRFEESAIIIEFSGPDESLLLDRRGELLESLQFLLGKVLQRRFGAEMRFLVD